ncbi:hypothetical protein HMPREF3159_00605 [Brachybacterium sp. HMSC06H03]|uniref:hypothetical protein n=1 Tax=Brachybacterium sp. HMSC06H03 TaxID=1581127 RepID=UPI0008A49773|nr:hypothetical protein [Brachybacterium sp. HMSC06H03]OFT65882.1 hypothetical protein HMPREF3159_00605 [Brachybacterium sp. HMSC06H03]
MTVTDWSPTDSDYQAQLRRAHEDLRASTVPDEAPWPVRAPVLDSWRRSLAALPDGTGTARAVLEGTSSPGCAARIPSPRCCRCCARD